jgi:hypothetical protein
MSFRELPEFSAHPPLGSQAGNVSIQKKCERPRLGQSTMFCAASQVPSRYFRIRSTSGQAIGHRDRLATGAGVRAPGFWLEREQEYRTHLAKVGPPPSWCGWSAWKACRLSARCAWKSENLEAAATAALAGTKPPWGSRAAWRQNRPGSSASSTPCPSTGPRSRPGSTVAKWIPGWTPLEQPGAGRHIPVGPGPRLQHQTLRRIQARQPEGPAPSGPLP